MVVRGRFDVDGGVGWSSSGSLTTTGSLFNKSGRQMVFMAHGDTSYDDLGSWSSGPRKLTWLAARTADSVTFTFGFKIAHLQHAKIQNRNSAETGRRRPPVTHRLTRVSPTPWRLTSGAMGKHKERLDKLLRDINKAAGEFRDDPADDPR